MAFALPELQRALQDAGYRALYCAERARDRFTANALGPNDVWVEGERCTTVNEAWRSLAETLLPRLSPVDAAKVRAALGGR